MASIDKVRIIVVGDSGVGKTSLTHLICQNEPITRPSWTVGCSVDVKLHEYKEGLPQQKTFFVELWDVGGSSRYRNTRSIFYNPVHGIILVHDLTNRKSQQNLQKWLFEVLNHESSGKATKHFDDVDPEQFFGSNQVPILVVGTKLGMAEMNRVQRSVTFADECGADEILLDCRQSNALAAGSTSAVKLTRFFDKVIESKIAASCSHAAVSCYVLAREKHPNIANHWLKTGQKKIVLKSVNGVNELERIYERARQENLTTVLIRDMGKTQVAPGSVTALGIGPGIAKDIHKIVSDFKLL
ncbi:UNVERIFIED_CONTAM: hypothetical protein PYX00_006822 [Menopon gallinae]|uniref:Rab-like protein 3 n=1 Tax=Menopon gallinae TaxID=328185 RepID=A0AAW2HXL1_9NEOP